MHISSKLTYLQIAHRAGFTFEGEIRFHTLRGGVQLRADKCARNDEPASFPLILLRERERECVISSQLHLFVWRADGSFDLLVAHADGPR